MTNPFRRKQPEKRQRQEPDPTRGQAFATWLDSSIENKLVYLPFGLENPRQMPRHQFPGAIDLNFDSAIKGDHTKQNFSVCPRFWHIDATLKCERCGDPFVFSAQEQKVWYEEYHFWVDSFPNKCKACRQSLRELGEIRQEYDRDIAQALASDDCALKARVASLVDRLIEAGEPLPEKLVANRKLLEAQIARRDSGNDRLEETGRK